MDECIDIAALFALEPKSDLPPPIVSPSYDPSSLKFLEGIHRRKSEGLKLLLKARGWPSSDKVKQPHAEEAAFMIVQHADYDPQLQRECHAMMVESVASGKTRPGLLAFLTDRILCNEGRHQRFGTQIREVTNGCFVPKPLEDPDHIDELRKQAGLDETLSDYLMRVNAGDLLLYRPLLDGYGEELEEIRLNKVVEFPVKG